MITLKEFFELCVYSLIIYLSFMAAVVSLYLQSTSIYLKNIIAVILSVLVYKVIFITCGYFRKKLN